MKSIFAILLLSAFAAFAQPYPVSVRTTNGTSFGLTMSGTTTAATVRATSIYSTTPFNTNRPARFGADGGLTNSPLGTAGQVYTSDGNTGYYPSNAPTDTRFTSTSGTITSTSNTLAATVISGTTVNATTAYTYAGSGLLYWDGSGMNFRKSGGAAGLVGFLLQAANGDVATTGTIGWNGTPVGITLQGNINRLNTNLVSSGWGVYTNGLASYSTVAAVTIAASGWTNIWPTNNAGVYVNATAVSWIIKNRANTTLYTSPTLTAVTYVHLQPGWAVSAASGLDGTALPE